MSFETPHLLGFAAPSGTGKTTLLEQLIPLLKAQGLKIGVIKASHHDFEIDYPGKDSHRLRTAGASPVLIVSPYRSAMITEFSSPQTIDLNTQLAAFSGKNLDLILVEGFRHEAFAKIELHRPSLGKPPLYPQDENIIAIATDQPLTTPTSLPCLDLNAPVALARFITHHFFKTDP